MTANGGVSNPSALNSGAAPGTPGYNNNLPVNGDMSNPSYLNRPAGMAAGMPGNMARAPLRRPRPRPEQRCFWRGVLAADQIPPPIFAIGMMCFGCVTVSLRPKAGRWFLPEMLL